MAKDCYLICLPCEGNPKYVKVSGNGRYETYYFQYCDKAIKDDRDNGWEVEEIDERKYLKGLKSYKTQLK